MNLRAVLSGAFLPGGSLGPLPGAAQTEGSSVSTWWPGLPWSPVGHTPKMRCGNTPPLSCGPTTCRTTRWGVVLCQMGGSEGQGSQRTRPERQKLALGMWNVTSPWGKEL